jgi:hypothetical protein
MQLVGRGDVAGRLALEPAHQLVHQGQLVLRGGATAQVLQGNADQTRQVPGQQARGFLGIQAVGGDQGFLQLVQLLMQALGEQLLIEARGVGPGRTWSGQAEMLRALDRGGSRVGRCYADPDNMRSA